MRRVFAISSILTIGHIARVMAEHPDTVESTRGAAHAVPESSIAFLVGLVFWFMILRKRS